MGLLVWGATGPASPDDVDAHVLVRDGRINAKSLESSASESTASGLIVAGWRDEVASVSDAMIRLGVLQTHNAGSHWEPCKLCFEGNENLDVSPAG